MIEHNQLAGIHLRRQHPAPYLDCALCREVQEVLRAATGYNVIRYDVVRVGVHQRAGIASDLEAFAADLERGNVADVVADLKYMTKELAR